MSCAPGYLLFLEHSVTGTHNHGSVGALNQGARSNGDGDLSHSVERPLRSIQHIHPYVMCWPSALIGNEVNPQLEGA
jgi:hypothetical protein